MLEETEEKANFLNERRHKCEEENLWREVRERIEMKKEHKKKAVCYK